MTFGQTAAAVAAACQSNWTSVETALQAYDAEIGSYPSPPSPWAAATYATNYQPFTTAGHGGPFLPTAPASTQYVIEYDAAGHVWVEPPGQYDAAYNPNRGAVTACYLVGSLTERGRSAAARPQHVPEDARARMLHVTRRREQDNRTLAPQCAQPDHPGVGGSTRSSSR